MPKSWWAAALLCVACGSDPPAGGGTGGSAGAGGAGGSDAGGAGAGGGAGADAAPPRLVELATLPPTLGGLAFAADAAGNDSLWVVTTGGTEVRKVLPGGATGAGFTVDGAGPLIALPDGRLLTGRAAGGLGFVTALEMDGSITDFAPSLVALRGPRALAAGPGGSVAVADTNGTVYLLLGSNATIITASVADPTALAWDVAGTSMLVGNAAGEVFEVARDPGSGAWGTPNRLLQADADLVSIVVQPSGGLLLTARGNGVSRWAPGDASPTRIAGNADFQFPVAATPGGPGFDAQGLYVAEFDRGKVSRLWLDEPAIALPRE